MRTLSKSKKLGVKKLCEKHQYFSDLFERDFLSDIMIEVTNDSINQQAELKFFIKDTGDGKPANQKMYEATDKIVQTINLLDYLSKESYVYSFKASHGSSVHGYIGLETVIKEYHDYPEHFTGSRYPDLETADFILEFIDHLFVSTEALKEYVKNGYKTDEQLRHKQNLIAAWVAIGISIILSLIGVFSAH